LHQSHFKDNIFKTLARKIKNLVLGSEGFIGKPFCSFLESKGEEVVHFDIKRSKQEDLRSAVLPLKGIDRIYFLAWDVGGTKYLFKEDSLVGQIEWNTKILMNTMPQLEKSGVPFLFISSQFAEDYGTPYGATKRLGEIWTRLLPNGHYVRQWNVYGVTEEQDERSHVISDFIHQAVENSEIQMLSNGEEHRQFIHLEDSFRAYHKVLSEKIKGGIYDVTSGEWIRIIDLAHLIADLTNATVKPGKKTVTDHRMFPINSRLPGWEPAISFEEGLAQLVKEYEK
jgi:nucleoside-diphosphate-sugar epimerase